jgi:hypothetical protein
MRLPAAELNQLCCRMRLLPNGRGVELPDELRCLTLQGLHLKQRQRNCCVHRWNSSRLSRSLSWKGSHMRGHEPGLEVLSGRAPWLLLLLLLLLLMLMLMLW